MPDQVETLYRDKARLLDHLVNSDDAAVRFVAKNRLWDTEIAVLERHRTRTSGLDSSSPAPHSVPLGSEVGASRFKEEVRKPSKGRATFGCRVTV